MQRYEDEVVRIDESEVLIKSYGLPGRSRTVPRGSIGSTEVIELGPFSGKYRLVGFGFRRPRYFFHWDSGRSRKTHGIALDTGRFVRPVITPDDHQAALAALGV